MSSDTRELETLIEDLKVHVPIEVQTQGINIVDRSSKRIVRDWKVRWRGHRDIKHLPNAITYDLNMHDESIITSEIGPENHRLQGPLGRIIELGTHTSAPIPGGFPALDAEEPGFIRQVETIKILGVKGD